MRDISTEDLINRIIFHSKALAKYEDILLLDRAAANATKVKAAQRNLRNAVTALNRHLKQCIKEVETSLITINETRKAAKLKKLPKKTHLYIPTRKGLKKEKR